MDSNPQATKSHSDAERKKSIRRRFIMSITSRWQLYLFLLLPLAYLILFAYVPMAGLQIAFKKYSSALGMGIWGSPWVGFSQFTKFFSSYMFKRVLTNTVSVSLYALLAGFPIPILFALSLNSIQRRRYKKTVQMVAYMPYFISTVVLVGMLMQMINPRIGIFGVAYTAMTGKDAPNLIGLPDAFRHLYVWSGIWQSVGWSSIIYLAALSGIDTELHEAAQIDGASRFQRVLHIDFPGIVPTAIILLILNSGQIMNVGFEKAFLMQNTLNLRSSEVISTYVYKVGLASGIQDFSYATAIGLFNSLINFSIIIFVNQIAKRTVGEGLW
ncbi:MAG: ABC transporter permease subunit [Clostridiales bacterium]|jgi:putative aldouronate transport system permease protein|nr:ABC transporter permease subunit [Clostridiales bacterium]